LSSLVGSLAVVPLGSVVPCVGSALVLSLHAGSMNMDSSITATRIVHSKRFIFITPFFLQEPKGLLPLFVSIAYARHKRKEKLHIFASTFP
jgi:hypothetical protein